MTAEQGQTVLKILVIDDSNTIRGSAEVLLRNAGHQPMIAENGFDALSLLADDTPDLIFCDVLMPGLDGYQTCALIKKNASFHATPVIMLSSKDGIFDQARGAIVGATACMSKPFSEDDLLQAVATYARQVKS